ncbi:hypothetical protein GCM10008956_14900 [Deinococcus arenae]|uniref:YycE-like C-terminal domain-containing protein n=1 Tax=Deinococcus arenae TaxID=1452751 RepID=A0A8H9GMR4_9DEIO|nr:hypothetical protein [Deinococcus arenae]AWT36403.1 hypothetical protein DM785_13185 [Deinococcus actinosclerus]GGM39490.1 hypothetical protein GCM10008956_14900 [Deinococcus arenae]
MTLRLSPAHHIRLARPSLDLHAARRDTWHSRRRVTAPNPSWDRWGVTMRDPDGGRLVLCERTWRSVP